MKTVIVGASAHSTPALFDIPRQFLPGKYAFTLVARNLNRLAAVGRAIEIVAGRRGYQPQQEHVPIDELGRAVVDADLIVLQIRTGGYAARAWDEEFPLRYDQCGDEGLGVGGLAAAWRTWPELREILERIALTGSRALILLLTSPVSILSRCAIETFPELDIRGICELPWTTLVDLCGHECAMSVRFSYAGVNHLGWIANVRTPDRVFLKPSEVLALKYVSLEDDRERNVAEQRGRRARARELQDLSEAAFRRYENGDVETVLAAVRRRSTPWYSYAVAPLIAGMAGEEVAARFFLTSQNSGYCSWLADDDVLEMPYTIREARLTRDQPLTWTRRDIVDRLRSLVRYESAASAAVRSRDCVRLASAIDEHPWLAGRPANPGLLRDVLRTPPALDGHLSEPSARVTSSR